MDHTLSKSAYLEPLDSVLSVKRSSVAYRNAVLLLKNPFVESIMQTLESTQKTSSAYLEPITAASSLKNPLSKGLMRTLELAQKTSSVYLEPITAASSLKNPLSRGLMRTLESAHRVSSAHLEPFDTASSLKNPSSKSMVQALESAKKISSYLDSSSEKIIFPDLFSIDKEARETLDDGDNFSDDDFVTFNEEPIQEWNIPDTIAIPVGNKRIRMKTDMFISILSSIILPIFFWVSGLIVDLHDAYLKAETESQRLEIEQERNDLIRESNHLFSQYIDILMSTDTSNSSEADEIEKWKESLPKPDSVPTTADLTPDNPQVNHNNSPE